MDLNERRQLPLFSIGVVQKLTGLSARQIRYYEQHGLVVPARSEGKQRLFSFADVEQLMEVRRMLDEGMNMSSIKMRFSAMSSDTQVDKHTVNEPTDEELYKKLQQDLLERQGRADSMFMGDLSRFYRKK